MDDFTTNDFTTRTYGTSGLDNRLLFGETSARMTPFCVLLALLWTPLTNLQTSFNARQLSFRGLQLLLNDRAINLVVGGLTSLLVVVTVISSFLFPSLPPWPLNVFLAFCILLTCGSAMVLIVWYRQGDLDPKFRKLIYYMLASIMLLCLCANLYYHDVGRGT
uniref:Transmembrane protein 243, mitochondrial b n=1 Tax=Oncorhynchus tshawytscha TaxID=74940 RepID=A0AAZ3RKI7_ONCTS